MQFPGESLGGPEGNGGQHFKMNSKGNLKSKVSLNFSGNPIIQKTQPPGCLDRCHVPAKSFPAFRLPACRSPFIRSKMKQSLSGVWKA